MSPHPDQRAALERAQVQKTRGPVDYTPGVGLTQRERVGTSWSGPKILVPIRLLRPVRCTHTTPTAASRPRVRRTRAQRITNSSSSADPDPPLGPGVVSIAEAARLVREGQQLSLWDAP
jgi:hypothetical protein